MVTLMQPHRVVLKKEALLEGIQELAEQQVVVPLPNNKRYQGFYIHVFIVRKPSGKYCLITHLRNLKVAGIQEVLHEIYSVHKNLRKEAFMTT